MSRATVTSKGQVTLPKPIRDRLGIEAGDKLVFDIDGDELRVRVLHHRSVDELFAALPGADRYAGEEAERDALGVAFAEKHRA